MKKLLIFSVVMILMLSGCKKEIKQLPFTLKNLSTLIERSSDYITKASPGTIDEVDENYIYFLLEDVIGEIDKAFIYYDLDEDLCDFVLLFSQYQNALDDALAFVDLSETELGEGEYYNLVYYDDTSTLIEKFFMTFEALLLFIESNSMTVDDVSKLMAVYHINEFYFMSGGYYDASEGYFISLIEIGLWEDLAIDAGNHGVIKSAAEFNRHEVPVK